MATSTQSMEIKFDGQSHQVDANTLINALIHYQNLINITNQSYGQGEREVKMRVNAIKEGSFVIDISIQETLCTLFSGEGIAYLAGLVTIVSGVVKLYKNFKGKPIAEKEQGSLTINKDTVISKQIVNVYNQPITREAISKSIETASEDDNVEGLTISFGEKTNKDIDSTSFKREEFKEYIYTDFDTEVNLPEERALEEEAALTITSLSFEGKSKWRFVYNGFPISMYVKDDALTKAINKGERFGKGDALRVRLRIIQKYNEDFHTYVNYSYSIKEVFEHIKAPAQSKLDL